MLCCFDLRFPLTFTPRFVPPGHVEPAPSRSPTRTAVSSASPTARLRPVAPRARIEIDLRTPGAATVTGEQSEVLLIIENLVSNAERHGAPPIEVAIMVDNGQTTLSVSDGGDGVRSEDRQHIFERGVSSHPDGEGLGLGRARLLARRNHAQLDMEHESDRTTFTLTMPTSPSSITAATR